MAPPARGVKGAATAAPTAATNAGPAIAGTASGADATPAGPAEWPPAPQPAAAAAPAHQQASGMPCAASAQACVSLSRHEAWLTDGNGRITYGPVPATGGKLYLSHTDGHPRVHVIAPFSDLDHRHFHGHRGLPQRRAQAGSAIWKAGTQVPPALMLISSVGDSRQMKP